MSNTLKNKYAALKQDKEQQLLSTHQQQWQQQQEAQYQQVKDSIDNAITTPTHNINNGNSNNEHSPFIVMGQSHYAATQMNNKKVWTRLTVVLCLLLCCFFSPSQLVSVLNLPFLSLFQLHLQQTEDEFASYTAWLQAKQRELSRWDDAIQDVCVLLFFFYITALRFFLFLWSQLHKRRIEEQETATQHARQLQAAREQQLKHTDELLQQFKVKQAQREQRRQQQQQLLRQQQEQQRRHRVVHAKSRKSNLEQFSHTYHHASYSAPIADSTPSATAAAQIEAQKHEQRMHQLQRLQQQRQQQAQQRGEMAKNQLLTERVIYFKFLATNCQFFRFHVTYVCRCYFCTHFFVILRLLFHWSGAWA